MLPVFAFPFLVRLRDHGAWPGISQYSIISHFLSRIFYLAFFISHFYLAFLSHISHFYLASGIFISHLASRIFISHFYLTSRIFISHLVFFISHLAFFISHLAFLSRIFISHLVFLSRISYFYLASRIFLSRISHFYLAFNSIFFFLLLLSCISNVPYRLPYKRILNW